MAKFKFVFKACVFLFFLSACDKDEIIMTGEIYDSNEMSIASITSAVLYRYRDRLELRYPKYNCLKVKSNINNLTKEELTDECTVIDDFFKEKSFIYPKKKCVDIYGITYKNLKEEFTLLNKNNPCYSFSQWLANILKNEDGLILQFYTENGNYQGEFLER